MKLTVEYPIFEDQEDGAWVSPANIVAFAQALESAGFSGMAFTDHPAPSKKWLDAGGHETFDPFVALGFVAAATSTIRLFTYLTVVPYRNPLLLARSMTTVDVLSGGRATFVLGTGYLRSEFSALGVDFEERNALFDEAIEVLLGVWSSDDFSYEGRHFTARGQIIKPGPVQKPHPPLWLGGNAGIVRERVATWGQGWAPMQGGATLSRTARTAAIETDDDLAALLADLDTRLSAHGRSMGEIDIMGSVADAGLEGHSPEECVAALRTAGELGLTWARVDLPRTSFQDALRAVQKYGDEVIAKL